MPRPPPLEAFGTTAAPGLGENGSATCTSTSGSDSDSKANDNTTCTSTCTRSCSSTGKSSSRAKHPLADIPVLRADEILAASELGRGGFCAVSAVRGVALAPSAPSDGALALSSDEVAARQRLARQFQGYDRAHYSYCDRRREPGASSPRSGSSTSLADPTEQKPPRIAVKRLKSNLGRKRYEIGLKDLTSEVTLLGSLGNSHPNIIGLYAVGFDDAQQAQESCAASAVVSAEASVPSPSRRITFAVIDQLRSTLKNKLYMWREARGWGIFISRRTLNELWLERIVILMRVSSAVAFLHERGIVHRDVNPDNIGFDSDDVPKLFDFGLARRVGDTRMHDEGAGGGTKDTTVPETRHDEGEASPVADIDDDAVYEMTANTGTVRYMAPEVSLGMPYGTKVDVYSLSIVMHEVLSLYKPFSHVPATTFVSTVAIGGLRPPVDASWPEDVQDLLRRMWDANSSDRPSAREVVNELENLLRGSDDKLYPKAAIRRLFLDK